MIPLDGLLARATSRETVRAADGKSGSVFERLVIDGERHFLKRSSPGSDWVMRVSGDRVHRPYLVWRAGIMDRAPACIDHTVVAMEVAGAGKGAVLSVLMRDVAGAFVPEGDTVVSVDQHRGFVESLAELSAAFWGFEDPIGGLSTMEERLRVFAPDNIAPELAVEEVPGPIAGAERGWGLLASRSPELLALATAVHARPELVAAPLGHLPVTFLHGDWKMGNLGTHPDGRTVLVDWAFPGSGPACWDLWWYIALNRARLPESKEATVDRFRAALERRGIATAGWWEAQLDLCCIGMMAAFGWEKALGDDAELRWWEDRVMESVRRQRLSLPGAPR